MQAGHGDVQLGAAGILQCQKLVGVAVDGQGFQSQIAAHPVVDVYHRRTDAQLRQVAVACVVHFGGFFPAPALQHPFAEQRRFRHQCQPVCRQYQPLFQGRDGDAQSAAVLVQESVPVRDSGRGQAIRLQILQQRLAAPRGFGADQDPAAELLQEVPEPAGRVRRTSVHGDVRQGLGVAVMAAGAVRRCAAWGDSWVGLEVAEQLVRQQEQLGRRQDRP